MHNSESDFPGCLIYKTKLVDVLRYVDPHIWPPTGIFARLNVNQAGGGWSACHDVSLVVTLRHDVRSPGCKLNYENFVVVSKPQNMGVTLTTQTTGSFRSFIVELQICNSPTSQRNFELCFKVNKLQRQSANLHSGTILTSYRRNRSGFLQWYVIFSFSRYISTRRR